MNRISNDLYLFFALTGEERMECTVKKAAELGVYEIIPVVTERCAVRFDAKKAERKRTRWQALCDDAAAEAERSFFPHVHSLLTFQEALAYAREHCDIRFVPYENEHDMEKTKKAFEALRRQPGASVGILIGPEGGFSDREIELAGAEMDIISLGQQVLHNDTAAICTLYLLMLAITG